MKAAFSSRPVWLRWCTPTFKWCSLKTSSATLHAMSALGWSLSWTSDAFGCCMATDAIAAVGALISDAVAL